MCGVANRTLGSISRTYAGTQFRAPLHFKTPMPAKLPYMLKVHHVGPAVSSRNMIPPFIGSQNILACKNFDPCKYHCKTVCKNQFRVWKLAQIATLWMAAKLYPGPFHHSQTIQERNQVATGSSRPMMIAWPLCNCCAKRSGALFTIASALLSSVLQCLCCGWPCT